MMRYLKIVFLIAVKDLRSETRARDILPQMLAFSITVMVVFAFVFEPGAGASVSLVPGILLVAFSFSGLLGLSRAFASERENEAIRGLMLVPVPRSAIYLGKLASNFIFVSVVGLLSSVILIVLFNAGMGRTLPAVFLVMELVAVGFVAVGTLYAAMTSTIRLREVLLPILMFPILVPELISGVKLLRAVMEGRALAQEAQWLRLLLAYDVIFLTVGILTFEYVIIE